MTGEKKFSELSDVSKRKIEYVFSKLNNTEQKKQKIGLEKLNIEDIQFILSAIRNFALKTGRTEQLDEMRELSNTISYLQGAQDG